MRPDRTTCSVACRGLISAACVVMAGVCLPVAAQVGVQLTSKLDQTALNPQPLPPKAKSTHLSRIAQPPAGQDRSIIVGGRPAGAADLNPQPLPPKASQGSTTAAHTQADRRGIIIVGGKGTGGVAPAHSLSISGQKGQQ